ncbi:MAG: RMD1 family protein [Clostridia bacterium]|nr:RMD1 family protein [Clostridia bacterium]
MLFRGYKIAPRLSLKQIVAFFKLQKPLSWQDYVVLEESHIDTVLKYKSTGKKVYLFQFGCVCFVNFEQQEVFSFLEYIESIIGVFDYNLFSKYNEDHIVKIDDNGMCKVWRTSETLYPYKDYIPHIVSVILAKSIELYKLELDVTGLLDKAENFFIFYPRRGRLYANKKRFIAITSQILRFEHESIDHIRILERSLTGNQSIISREIYDYLAQFYELNSRFDILENKINNLRSIIKTCSTLSYRRSQVRLLKLEVFLLALFPLFHIAHSILDAYHITSVFKLLFG